MTTTLIRVRQMVADNRAMPREAIAPETDFNEHLGMDAIDMIELGFEIEAAFAIDLTDADYENIKTVADLVKTIENYRPHMNGARA